MIAQFDFVLLLCFYGCMNIGSSEGNRPPHCSSPPCLASTQCPDTTCPTQNTSTSVCSCPTIVDCSKCPTTITSTARDAMTTTPQTATVATTTIPTTSSSASPEAVIGAAIGGTIFGSILTAVIFVYIHRRSKNPYNSRNDETSRTVRNAAYGYNNDNDQVNSVTVPVSSAYSEINDGMRKSAVISPIMRQADSSKIDEVYNHLHESDKEDRSDYYDHAGPAPSLSVMEDGYGVLSMESEDNDNYNTVDRNYSTDCGESITAENTKSDNYFILETQNN